MGNTIFMCMNELSDVFRSLRDCGLNKREIEEFTNSTGFDINAFRAQQQFLEDSEGNPSEPNLEDYFDLSREVNREENFQLGKNGKFVTSIDEIFDKVGGILFNKKLSDTSLSPASILTYIMASGLIVTGLTHPNKAMASPQDNLFDTLDNIHLSGTVYGVCQADTTRAPFPTLKVVGEQSLDTLETFYGDSLGNWSDSLTVGIDDLEHVLPDKVRLYQNYPNPFNPSTVIEYDLSKDSKVSLILYNILGQKARKLFSGHKQAGHHSIVWDGKNDFGRNVSAGVYIYRLTADNYSKSKKLVKLDGGNSSGIILPRSSGFRVLGKTAGTEQAQSDSTFTFVVSADTIDTLVEQGIQLYDGIILDFYAQLKNRVPSVENVLITPSNPIFGDTLRLFYDFIDTDGDSDQSIKEWYRNSELTGVSGLLFPPDSTEVGDSIKAIVIPYDGELYGNSEESNIAVVQPLPTRTLTGIITEFFSGAPDDSALVRTSIDSAYTDENGAYAVLASAGREDVLVLKSNRFESGFILQPGTIDTVVNRNIAKDDSAGGIDRWLFENYIVSNRLNGPPFPPDLIYVSLTEESVPDTVYIAGEIDWISFADGFRNVAQLNKLGEKINVTADSVTNGLYNNNTPIIIADSNFTHPDSIALFAYPNMYAVNNEEFPSTVEELKNYFVIYGIEIGLGFNGTFYDEDNLTIKGHYLKLGNYLTPEQLGAVFDTEFCSSILGGVETPGGYPSVLAPAGGPIRAHDYRIFYFVLDRGPGRIFPDFPADFNPELIEKYAPGILERIKSSRNTALDLSKFHHDKATGLYFRKH